MKENQENKHFRKKEDFNYLNLKTAGQVWHLITKCQDSLDRDFLNLYRFRKVFVALVNNKFTEQAQVQKVDRVATISQKDLSQEELEGGSEMPGPQIHSEEIDFEMEEGIFSEGENNLQADMHQRLKVAG